MCAPRRRCRSVAAGRSIPDYGFRRGRTCPLRSVPRCASRSDRSYCLISSQALSTWEAKFSVLPRRNRRPAAPVGFTANRRHAAVRVRIAQTLMMRRVIGIGGTVLVLILLVFARKELPLRAEGTGVQGLQPRRRRAHPGVGRPEQVAVRRARERQRQRRRAAGHGQRLRARRPSSWSSAPRAPITPASSTTRTAIWSRRSSSAATASRGSPTSCRRALGDRGEEATRRRSPRQMLQLRDERRHLLAALRPALRVRAEGARAARHREAAAEPFLSDIGWLDAATVAGPHRAGSARARPAAARGGPVAPGLHGTGLGTVTVQPGGTQLNEGGATQIKAAPNTVVRRPGARTRARTTRRTSRSRSRSAAPASRSSSRRRCRRSPPGETKTVIDPAVLDAARGSAGHDHGSSSPRFPARRRRTTTEGDVPGRFLALITA